MYDLENPYTNVIGFLVPLPSIADYLMSKVGFGGAPEEEQPQQEPTPEQEPQEEPLPDQEQAPDEEDQDLKEIFMWRAGLSTSPSNKKN